MDPQIAEVRVRVRMTCETRDGSGIAEVYRPGEAPDVHETPTSVRGSGPVREFGLVMARVWG
jgi:hypothetical protein